MSVFPIVQTRVIDREDARIRARLSAHYANDVWEHRRTPPDPEEWSRPLPDHLAEAAEESYLRSYRERLEGKVVFLLRRSILRESFNLPLARNCKKIVLLP